MNINSTTSQVLNPALADLIFEKRKGQIAISEKLAAHQTVEKWKYRKAAIIIHGWANSMLVYFFDGMSAYPSICFRQNRLRNLGHYKPFVNAFGLEHEINLNSLHLGRPAWEVATTLLHEIAHMFCRINKLHVGGNCHNKAFRKMMKSFGITVDRNGHHIGKYDPNSMFEKWLEENKVGSERFLPEEPERFFEKVQEENGGKLKKYTCGCGYNIRVARKGFRGLCLNCKTEFQLVSRDAV